MKAFSSFVDADLQKKMLSDNKRWSSNYINLLILDEDTMEYEGIDSVAAVILVFYDEPNANLLKLNSTSSVYKKKWGFAQIRRRRTHVL